MHYIQKISNIHKIVRIVAYVFRAIGKMRKKNYPEFMSGKELISVKSHIIKLQQNIDISEEINMLRKMEKLA